MGDQDERPDAYKIAHGLYSEMSAGAIFRPSDYGEGCVRAGLAAAYDDAIRLFESEHPDGGGRHAHHFMVAGPAIQALKVRKREVLGDE